MSVEKKQSAEDIRVITRIPRAHAELLTDLLALPARDRPERLRLLASIGLAFSTRRGGDAVADKPLVSTVRDEKAVARRAAFSLLAGSISTD